MSTGSCVAQTIAVPVVRASSAKSAPDRARVRLVEPRRRLVREQHRRPRGERARDRDALPLPHRQPRDPLPGELAEADGRERALGAGRRLLARDAAQRERELDRLPRGEERDEVGALRDEPDLRAAKERPLRRVEPGERRAEHADVAGGRPVETGEEVEERRLPRPGRARERRELAGGEREREPVEHLGRARAACRATFVSSTASATTSPRAAGAGASAACAVSAATVCTKTPPAAGSSRARVVRPSSSSGMRIQPPRFTTA